MTSDPLENKIPKANAMEYYAVDEQGSELYWPYLLSTISEYQEPWTTYPQIKDHSLEQIEKLRYAWDISKDKDFVLTLKAENGTIDPTRRSNMIGSNGHWDYGICQLNYQWHSGFIDSPDFKDWRKQVDYCLEVYNKRHGAFYGFYNRHKVTKYFKFK